MLDAASRACDSRVHDCNGARSWIQSTRSPLNLVGRGRTTKASVPDVMPAACSQRNSVARDTPRSMNRLTIADCGKRLRPTGHMAATTAAYTSARSSGRFVVPVAKYVLMFSLSFPADMPAPAPLHSRPATSPTPGDDLTQKHQHAL